MSGVQGLGFRVSGLGFKMRLSWFRVDGSAIGKTRRGAPWEEQARLGSSIASRRWSPGFGFWVWGFGIRVSGLGMRVSGFGLGIRVSGVRCKV